MGKIKTIDGTAMAEVEEKRSKFIANIFHVESAKEAENVINQSKKKYHDARHNCYAYIVNEEVVTKKASDDGEPSGTAGSPILNVLERNNLSNVLVIVTRYFGGILLGTGGLIRAYTEATKRVVEIANIIEEEEGYETEILISYQNFEKLKYYCNTNNIKIINIEYGENVKCIIEATEEDEKKIKNNFSKYENKIIKVEVISKRHIKR